MTRFVIKAQIAPESQKVV